MNCVIFVMYLVHAVLILHLVELRQKPVYNLHRLVRIVPVQYEDGGCGGEEFYKVEFSEMGGMISRSLELVVIDDSTAKKKCSRG